MLDVTDKGIINHVLAYSNSANAKQFSYWLFVVLLTATTTKCTRVKIDDAL